MGAIIDTVYLGQEEISKVREEYPDAVIKVQTFSTNVIQRYRVIIPDCNWFDENYYLFLLDNRLANSSTAFCSRVESDHKFAEKMKAKLHRGCTG